MAIDEGSKPDLDSAQLQPAHEPARLQPHGSQQDGRPALRVLAQTAIA
jgi:hypothetical protein